MELDAADDADERGSLGSEPAKLVAVAGIYPAVLFRKAIVDNGYLAAQRRVELVAGTVRDGNDRVGKVVDEPLVGPPKGAEFAKQLTDMPDMRSAGEQGGDGRRWYNYRICVNNVDALAQHQQREPQNGVGELKKEPQAALD